MSQLSEGSEEFSFAISSLLQEFHGGLLEVFCLLVNLSNEFEGESPFLLFIFYCFLIVFCVCLCFLFVSFVCKKHAGALGSSACGASPSVGKCALLPSDSPPRGLEIGLADGWDQNLDGDGRNGWGRGPSDPAATPDEGGSPAVKGRRGKS